jgi:hypothetical protein
MGRYAKVVILQPGPLKYSCSKPCAERNSHSGGLNADTTPPVSSSPTCSATMSLPDDPPFAAAIYRNAVGTGIMEDVVYREPAGAN